MKKVITIIFFALVGLVADRVNVAAVWGAQGQTFTLLQLFAPAVGAFLGGVSGLLTVALTEVASFVLQGKAWTLMNALRMLPLLFATLYFAAITRPQMKWSKVIQVMVPGLAMLAFWIHPIGRTVWYYALYWTIPMIIAFTPLKKYLLGKALGSTFTAHAVGGAYWIWLTNMAAPLWIGLIPVVAIERSSFALGIAVTYMAVNSLLAAIPAIQTLPLVLNTKYRFFHRIFHSQ